MANDGLGKNDSPKLMTFENHERQELNKNRRDQIVDDLRSCQTTEEFLAFEAKFNIDGQAGPLYMVICDFLHNRTISRAIAAKWLRTMLLDRDEQLEKLSLKLIPSE